MKKKLVLIFLILLMTTGCVRLETTDNYIDLVNIVLNDNNKVVNKASTGYKYYLPMGVRLVYDNNNNQRFKVENEDIYLYVDVVSYYYKNKLNLMEEEDSYYYAKINHDDKSGYIMINNENEDEYFLKIVYNYAKIEGYVKKNNIDKIITYGMIILDSIEYNQNLISTLLTNSGIFSTENTYELDKPEDATSKFSQYLEEYVQEEIVEDQLPEE